MHGGQTSIDPDHLKYPLTADFAMCRLWLLKHEIKSDHHLNHEHFRLHFSRFQSLSIIIHNMDSTTVLFAPLLALPLQAWASDRAS